MPFAKDCFAMLQSLCMLPHWPGTASVAVTAALAKNPLANKSVCQFVHDTAGRLRPQRNSRAQLCKRTRPAVTRFPPRSARANPQG